MTLSKLLQKSSSTTRSILEKSLEGSSISKQDAAHLFTLNGIELHLLCLVADHLREQQVGNCVSYVVNRNINFTNVCIKSCKFCAFARGLRSEEGYFLTTDQIIRKTTEAVEVGATEICLQAGLAPNSDRNFYRNLLEKIKNRYPHLHIHAFSPEEIKYGAGLAGTTIPTYLSDLKKAGLDSLPGTSAEILDDELRRQIAPGRITTDQWMHVIRSAHELGIPTTATMMFGHAETIEQRINHLALLRQIQWETGGFTEFVPLSFVHEESPLYLSPSLPGIRPGPSGNDIIKLYAISRLMLGASFKNIQASWVKEGLRQTQWLLSCGVNDVGGTLINESISTTAGARHGQRVNPATLRHLIRGAGRIPVQRTTTYGKVKEFPQFIDPKEQEKETLAEPLNSMDEKTNIFGSYRELADDKSISYEFNHSMKRSLKQAPSSRSTT